MVQTQAFMTRRCRCRRSVRIMAKRSALALAILTVCAMSAVAVDGIAVTTHREPGRTSDWHGFRVNAFGTIVRHDLVNSKVVRCTTLYAHDSARCVVIDQSGSRIAFVKRDGGIHVMNIDGTGLTALPSGNIRHTSWLDWPSGDWVYYTEESLSELCAASWYDWDPCTGANRLRRVNVVTGDDELAAQIGGRAWQLGMQADAAPDSGRLVISGASLDSMTISVRTYDLREPLAQVLAYGGCGASMSPSGNYVTVNTATHRDIKIMSWEGDHEKVFHMNAWAKPEEYDGREQYGYWTSHRWSCNSDKWVFLVQGRDFWGSTYGDAYLYNWQDEEQIRVTWNNPNGGDGADDPEDFWVDRRPRFSIRTSLLHFATQTELRLPLTNGGELGTIPPAEATPLDGSWLAVTVEGTGNEQVLVNTVQRTGLATGDYYDTVLVDALSGDVPPVRYAVRLSVGPYVPASVTVLPASPWVTPGTALSFTARVHDQFGNPLNTPVQWSLPEDGGVVDSSGHFTAHADASGQFPLLAVCRDDTTVAGTTHVTVADVPQKDLLLWLRADTGVVCSAGTVMAWHDLSPEQNTATLSTDGAAALVANGAPNGLPVLRFSGDGHLSIDPMAMDSFTILAACEPSGPRQPHHFLLGGNRQGVSSGGLTPGYSEYGVWYGHPDLWPGKWV
ncbi:MAG: hypothetical protein GF331_06635, partial [Chitinivibrionales bacterium]|nr:hypothetical protein [Chitinivibrionales bacterium]